MKTNKQIEEFVKNIDEFSNEEIMDFIEDVKNPASKDRENVLKHVENMLIDCMECVYEVDYNEERDFRKLDALTNACKAVASIEDTLSWF